MNKQSVKSLTGEEIVETKEPIVEDEGEGEEVSKEESIADIVAREIKKALVTINPVSQKIETQETNPKAKVESSTSKAVDPRLDEIYNQMKINNLKEEYNLTQEELRHINKTYGTDNFLKLNSNIQADLIKSVKTTVVAQKQKASNNAVNIGQEKSASVSQDAKPASGIDKALSSIAEAINKNLGIK